MIDKFGIKWIEINLSVFEHNIKQIKKHVSPSKVMAVVKADGYGHGSSEIASSAKRCGITMFGVSCMEEAVDLRHNFIKGEILIFGVLPESQICDVLNFNLTPTICSEKFAHALEKEAVRLGKNVDVHICVDTGMGRVGPLYSDSLSLVKTVQKLKNIRLKGIYSHFATADDERKSFAMTQLKRFQNLNSELVDNGIKIPLIHLANSGGILNMSGSFYNMVRSGLLMYGIYPCKIKDDFLKVKSVYSFKTRVTYKKSVEKGFTVGYGKRYTAKGETDIITLPVGYADGIPRNFSEKGEVLIRKKRFPVIGSVCMDMIMVDCGKNSGIKDGDEVVIIGKQGKEEISVYDIAGQLKTIPYEVICSIGRRVTRVYLKDKEVYSIKRMVSEF